MILYTYYYNNNYKIINYQIIEKGSYNRIQYNIINNTMTPNFIVGYYYILRDYNTGIEYKQTISEEEYNSYVLGDTVEKFKNF